MEGENFSELKMLVNIEKLSFLFLHKVPFFLFVFICRVENFEISVAVRMCPLVLTHSFVAVAVACCIGKKTERDGLDQECRKLTLKFKQQS